jgi:hypothetical protein
MMKYAGLSDYSEIIEGPGELLNKKGPGEELAGVPASKLLLYPNPAGDVVNVEFEVEGKGELLFIDMWGRQVIRLSVSGKNAKQINTSDFPAGLYTVLLQNTEGKILESSRIILQQ